MQSCRRYSGGFLHRSSGLHSTIRGECIILSRALRYLQPAKQKQLYVPDCRGSSNMECKNNTAGANRCAAVRHPSVWLFWKGAPLISVLPAFAQQEGWSPAYGPLSLQLLQLLPPGPSSRCGRETRSKCQSICSRVVFMLNIRLFGESNAITNTCRNSGACSHNLWI